MPAQILPMMDSIHDQLAVQAQQQQNAYQQQLLQLHSAKQQFDIQQEQALAPLRQRALQGEIAKNNQAVASGIWALQQQKDLAPAKEKEASGLASEAQSRALLSNLQTKDYQDTSVERRKRVTNELDQQALNQQLTKAEIERTQTAKGLAGLQIQQTMQALMHDPEEFAMKKNKDALDTQFAKDRHDTSLDDLAVKKTAHLLTVLNQPEEVRNLLLDVGGKTNTFDPTVVAAGKAMPDLAGNVNAMLQRRLGQDAVMKYQQADSMQKDGLKEGDTDTINRAIHDKLEIFHQFVLQGEANKKFIDAKPLPPTKDALQDATVYATPKGPMRYARDPEDGQMKWFDPNDKSVWPKYPEYDPKKGK